MADNQFPVAFDPFFGGFVLESLTIGMYGEARNAIREYIQNSFDSVQRAIYEMKILSESDGLIEIEMGTDQKSLVVRDNGGGLPAKTAAAILTRVGSSSKRHHKHAGFRGIGRLSGIVFSDTITFTTQAKGERKQTTVVFNGKAMRAAMAPAKGSRKSAIDLMKENVVAFQSPGRDTREHFFEVKLEGFNNAPDECRSAKAMYDFVSQVAPVPYPDDFAYQGKLQQSAKQWRIRSRRYGYPSGMESARRSRSQSDMVRATSSNRGLSPLTIALYITHRLISGGLGSARKLNPVRTVTPVLGVYACASAIYRSMR